MHNRKFISSKDSTLWPNVCFTGLSQEVKVWDLARSKCYVLGQNRYWPIVSGKKVKCDHRSKFSNLSNRKEEAWKKNQGFNGIRTRDLRDTGAMLYQLSYEATHWERGQFIEFISSRAVKWCEVLYEIIHIYWMSPISLYKPWFFSGFFFPIA